MRGFNHQGCDLVNLTSHVVRIDLVTGELVLPPSGLVARVLYSQDILGYINAVPVVHNTNGELKCLPSSRDATYYITSAMVAMNTDRCDVVCPNTNPPAVVRDEFGNVKATKSLLSFNLGKTLFPQ